MNYNRAEFNRAVMTFPVMQMVLIINISAPGLILTPHSLRASTTVIFSKNMGIRKVKMVNRLNDGS